MSIKLCTKGLHDLAIHGRTRPDRPAGNIYCHTCKLEHNRAKWAEKKGGNVKPRKRKPPPVKAVAVADDGRYQASEYWYDVMPKEEGRCRKCREPQSWCICEGAS